MRVTSSLTYRNFLTSLDTLNAEMDTANQQISTGKRLLHLNDSPAGSAELVDLRSELSRIDQYQSNADSGFYLLNVADSAMNSVHNIVTSIFTKGSAAGSDTNSAVRASLAMEIRTLRDQLLALANSEARGRYIFAGSEVLSAPFTIAGDTVTYHGDLAINSIEVSDGLTVRVNVPGSAVFSSIFDNINALLSALDRGDKAAIGTALGQFSGTLNSISQVRARLGSDLGRVQDVKSQLDGETTNIRMRRSQVEDANLAEAITQLTQIQTALKSTLTAQSLVGQHNLFDFLA